MIYTLTLNPALDHIVNVDNMKIGETNRMTKENIKPGGKGINVSKLLNNLGEETLSLAFVAGFTGDELEKILEEKDKLKTDFIHIESGFTRINVKIKDKKETEINGPGLEIDEKYKNMMLVKLKNIKKGDYLFLSGSIPKSLGDDFYSEIMKNIDKDIKVIVDSTGKSLKNTLEYKPFLIKPNIRELEDFFLVKIKKKSEIIHFATKLQKLGAKNVIVSMGKDGAFLLDENKREIFLKAPKGKVIDTVGSGDSMVAGFVYAIKNGYSYEDSFKFSLASGSATAFSKDLAKKEEIFKIYENL